MKGIDLREGSWHSQQMLSFRASYRQLPFVSGKRTLTLPIEVILSSEAHCGRGINSQSCNQGETHQTLSKAARYLPVFSSSNSVTASSIVRHGIQLPPTHQTNNQHHD